MSPKFDILKVHDKESSQSVLFNLPQKSKLSNKIKNITTTLLPKISKTIDTY